MTTARVAEVITEAVVDSEPRARVAEVITEAVVEFRSRARVAEVLVEVIVQGPNKPRDARESVEALHQSGTQNVRDARESVEALHQAGSQNVRSARESVEVLLRVPPEYFSNVTYDYAFTAVPGPPPTYVSGGLGAVQEGDLLFLQASAGSSAPALVLPAGWTQIEQVKGFQVNLLLAYRIWQPGDSTSAPTVTNAVSTAVTVYRGVSPNAYVTHNWWNSEVGGLVSVTESNSLVIDTMFNESLSTFTPLAPAGEAKRYGQVNGGFGMALADTAGTTVPTGTFDPAIWTGYDASTGTTNGIMVVFRPAQVPSGTMDVADAHLVWAGRTSTDFAPEPTDSVTQTTFLSRTGSDVVTGSDSITSVRTAFHTGSEVVPEPTDEATGLVRQLFVRFGVEFLDPPVDEAEHQTHITAFRPVFEPPAGRLTRVTPQQVTIGKTAMNWSSDVAVSQPRPYRSDQPVLIDMGGFGFTTGGLAHNLSEAEAEEQFIPLWSPEEGESGS